MRRDSSGLSWRGPRPGPIASTVTEHRSASRTGIATAPWRSMWAFEARNLAPLPGDVDFKVGASLPISGLTAQGLFEHGRLQAGQSVLLHGAAGAVGSMVTQLAREA